MRPTPRTAGRPRRPPVRPPTRSTRCHRCTPEPGVRRGEAQSVRLRRMIHPTGPHGQAHLVVVVLHLQFGRDIPRRHSNVSDRSSTAPAPPPTPPRSGTPSPTAPPTAPDRRWPMRTEPAQHQQARHVQAVVGVEMGQQNDGVLRHGVTLQRPQDTRPHIDHHGQQTSTSTRYPDAGDTGPPILPEHPRTVRNMGTIVPRRVTCRADCVPARRTCHARAVATGARPTSTNPGPRKREATRRNASGSPVTRNSRVAGTSGS